MCGAVGTFSCLDTTAKYLGRHIDIMQVVWARYTFALLLTFLISNPLSHPGLLRTARPALQIVRAAILLGSTMLNFFALKYLRLDQVLAITFSTPFIVAALSGPALGEWVGQRRWAAIGVGFIGVLVVTRPGFGIVHPAAMLAVLAAFSYAAPSSPRTQPALRPHPPWRGRVGSPSGDPGWGDSGAANAACRLLHGHHPLPPRKSAATSPSSGR